VECKNIMMIYTRTVGVIGNIPKTFRKHLSNMLTKNDIKELKKTTVLDTAQLLRKSVMQTNKTSNMRINITYIYIYIYIYHTL